MPAPVVKMPVASPLCAEVNLSDTVLTAPSIARFGQPRRIETPRVLQARGLPHAAAGKRDQSPTTQQAFSEADAIQDQPRPHVHKA